MNQGTPYISQNITAVSTNKVLPAVVDIEQAVLGALLIDNDSFGLISDLLNESSFYSENHQIIYSAIKAISEKLEIIDTLNVIKELRSSNKIQKIGGAKYLAQLANKVNSANNIDFHAEIVSQAAIKREMISTASKILEDSYNNELDSLELLNKTEQSFFKISEKNIRKNYASSGELIKKTISELDHKKKNNQDGVTGISSGFRDFDALTGGWQKTELSIIAARPGMGKTAFVVSTMCNAALDHNVPVAIFSLEMSASQLMLRMISAEAEIEGEKLRKGNLQKYEWEQLHTRVERLSKAPIFIDDTPALSIVDLRAKCRRLKSTHGIQMVIIDYLQLMTGDEGSGISNSREQEIATISRALKNLSKELDVPVLALSQLSRSVETRADKRPQLSDLRESGSIEQDADMVMFLYRPEYYKLTELEDGTPTAGLGELIIAKNRAGTTDNIRLQFVGEFTKFSNWGEGYSTTAKNTFAQGGGISAFESKSTGSDVFFQSFGSKANSDEKPKEEKENPFNNDGDVNVPF